MKQVAKNATMAEWGYLSGCTHLIMDRDTKYCAAFRSILESAGIHIIRLPWCAKTRPTRFLVSSNIQSIVRSAI